MALPTQTEILTAGYLFKGEPFVQIEAKSSVASMTGGLLFGGEPFVVPAGAAGGFVGGVGTASQMLALF